MAKTKKKDIQFRLLGDWILAERHVPQGDEVTKGGIIVPEMAKAPSLWATVVSVGPGVRDAQGRLILMPVKAGDQIRVAGYGIADFVLDDQPYIMLRQEAVLGVATGGDYRV